MLTVATIPRWLEIRALDEPGTCYGVGVSAVGVPGSLGALPAK